MVNKLAGCVKCKNSKYDHSCGLKINNVCMWCRGKTRVDLSCLLERVRGSLGTNLVPSQIKAGNSESLVRRAQNTLFKENSPSVYLELFRTSFLLSLVSSLSLSWWSSLVGTLIYRPFLWRRESFFPLEPKLLLSLDSVDSLAASFLAAATTRLDGRKFSRLLFRSWLSLSLSWGRRSVSNK